MGQALINFALDQHFPDCAQDEAYPTRLTNRIRALQRSPALAMVHPLEELWTGLAVQHLNDRDRSEQTIDAADYPTLASCSFVREKLLDWSCIHIGRPTEELRDISVIYQGDRPIYAGFPEFIARSAQRALDEQTATATDGALDVRVNPLLPWIAVAASGYAPPLAAASVVAHELDRLNAPAFLTQVAEIWRYVHADRHGSGEWRERRFVVQV